jgi:glycosyltransferase involved in cell wall biosynthesis
MPIASSDRPLRILHVVDSLERGGLERVVTDLALVQRRSDCEVEVFSIKEPGGFATELEAAGIRVLRGDKRRGADFATLRRLRRALVGRDIVHGHNFMPAYYAAAASLGLFRGPCLVGTCHDMGTRLENPKLRWIVGWALRRTRRVAMVGAQVFARYVDSGLVASTRAESILNGVPLASFRQGEAARHEARALLGLPADALVIGCVGRLVALKNHRLLIDLLPRLCERFPGLRLVIVGGGPLHEELSAQARALGVADRLTLAGERAGVSELLPAFDVFALPSQTEGLSIALLEAAASGLAIVATAVGGNPEIIHEGATGMLVPLGDADAMATALEALLRDPGRRASLGDAARAWVRQNASIEAMHVAYIHFYRRAMGGATHPLAPGAHP